MKFRVAKEHLLQGLQQVQSVISTRTTLPILQNVLIQTGPASLNLSTTDLDVGITCRIEAQILEEGATTLPAKRLVAICRELPTSEIDIAVDDRNVATMRCGNALFKIMGISKDEFPPFPKLENAKQISLDQGVLRDMLRKTSYAISHDETRYVLNGIYMSFRDNKLTMVATDGRRLALSDNELELSELQQTDVILPTKAVNEVQRMLNDAGPVNLSITETRIGTELNGTFLVSKLIEGTYPNYKQVIPSETKERVTLEREILLNCVRRVSLLASDKHNSVKFTFGQDSLQISSNSPDVGEARETLPVKYRGAEFSIAFNPDYLLDALKNLGNDQIHLDFVDELSPGVLRIDSSSFLYVIMPMRVA